MVRGGRNGTLSLLAFFVILCVAAPLLWTGFADAFFELHIDGRIVDREAVLIPLDSGVGIAAPLLAAELDIVVHYNDGPPRPGTAVELQAGDRRARFIVGERDAVVDGRVVRLSGTPQVENGTLFVPITFVADLARLRMQFDVLGGVLSLTKRDVGTSGVSVVVPPPTTRADGASGGDFDAAEGVLEQRPWVEDGEPRQAGDIPRDETSETARETRRDGGEVGSGDESGARDESGAVPAADEPRMADGLEPFLPHSPGDEGSVDGILPDRWADGPPVVVQDVQVVERDGHVHIEVFTDRAVAPDVILLDEPARVVVDVPGAVAATGWQTMPGDGAIVEQLRIHSGEDDGVRIVADLPRTTGYALSLSEDEPGFSLRLNHPLTLLDAASGADGVALDLATTGEVPYRAFLLREPDRYVVDLFGVSIRAAEERLLEGGWAASLRMSQFEQDAVRAVFTLEDGASAPLVIREGVLRPGRDGVLRMIVDGSGVAAMREEPEPPASGLQFVGFGRNGDLEYILIRAEEPMDVDVLRLRGPDRVVLDLSGLSVERSLGLAPEESRVVKAVRAGQAGEATARIVAETFGAAEHYLLLSPDRTRAVLGLRPAGVGGRTVVVDAGHGGKDPGAIGHSGAYEKDVTLSIALQVAERLSEAGANVVLTRDRDVEMSLAERAQMANALLADAFVSVHADAIGFGRIASGTSTFYHPENGSDGATSVNRQYALTLHSELLGRLGLPDRGVHERRFHVVLNTRMPAALVEVGFIDNPDEEQLLLDPDFQARAAAGIADGIVRFFHEQGGPSPEQLRDWQARTERATGLWLALGIVPTGVTALEPTALFTVAQTEGRLPAESEQDGVRPR